jgi:aminopeptidase N
MTFRDPASYTDLTQGKIKHIDFKIRADFDAHILDIEAVYQMDAPVSGSLHLDTNKIEMKSAHTNGRALAWEFDQHSERLGQRLHLKELDGASTFTLTFRTSPEATALQWTAAEQTAGGKHPFLFSQCQDINARSLFPCQDSPSVRFTYAAEVEAPKGLTAVMAAEQLGGEERGGKSVFKFRMPQAIPSYLFAIAIAHLTFHEFGPRTGMYAEPETIEAGAWEFAENEIKVTEAEKLLGPYRWGRYDVLVLPPTFPYGGMENPRLTFLTPTCILGTRAQTPLITHELAHAWTGNLVTNATWEDFWLNEGWTTYAEGRITEVLEGGEAADLYSVYHGKRLESIFERVGADSPQTCLKLDGNLGELEPPATSIPYYKGCFFIEECERAVGRARFDVFIQKYTARFQFQSLTTEGFLDFMKAELPEVFEKVDVQTWVYQPGMPASWHEPTSRLYDEVVQVLKDYEKGKRPEKKQFQNWHRHQFLALLNGLPKKMPVEDCKYFADALDLKKRNDGELFSFFYAICIASGYREIMPEVETFMATIGRMLYVFPVARALLEADWSRGQVRALFERVKSRHHQITVNGMERMLKGAGL